MSSVRYRTRLGDLKNKQSTERVKFLKFDSWKSQISKKELLFPSPPLTLSVSTAQQKMKRDMKRDDKRDSRSATTAGYM